MNSKIMDDKALKMRILPRALLSLLIGVSLAVALDLQFFNYDGYSPLDQFFLITVPSISLTFIAYYLLPHARDMLKRVTVGARLVVLGLAILAACILSFSTNIGPIFLLVVNLISSAAIFFGLLIQSAPFVQYLIEQKTQVRVFFGWLLAMGGTFFVVGFLSNFYSRLYEIVLLTFLIELALGLFIYYLLGKIKSFAQKGTTDFWIVLTQFILLFGFLAAIFWLCLQFPNLFDARAVLLEANQIAFFVLTSLVSLPWLAWALYALKERGLYDSLRQGELFAFIDENLAGILLAGLFFAIYSLLGIVFNQQRFDVDDIFFDADAFIWRYRLATDHWQDFYWRAVHPLALLILRPTVGIVAAFLKGDLPTAAVLVAASAGASCVFLAWIFTKQALRNAVAALLVASLLGASASHLIFGSLIETYIFLSASSLLFFVLLQRGKFSLAMLVPVGLVTIGITLTNFFQTVIALFIVKPDAKLLIRYVLFIVVLLVPLSLLNNLFYPDANPLFFVPSSFLAETQNIHPVSPERIQAIARTVFFYSIAAPNPLLSYRDVPFTQFRFYRPESRKYRLSEYETPLQTMVVWFWVFLLTLAFISFIRNLKSRNIRFSVALLLCVVLNMALHLRYGKELFLYSANWTYALVLFLGLAWEKLFEHKWFHGLLVIFLLSLIANNAYLIHVLMNVSAPYLK